MAKGSSLTVISDEKEGTKCVKRSDSRVNKSKRPIEEEP